MNLSHTNNQHTPFLTRAFVLRSLAAAAVLALAGFSACGCSSSPTSESTGEYLDSSTITTKVKAALVSDEVVSAADVKVKTYKSIVQLSGFVATQAEKDRAAVVASNVPGVKSVENNITVKPQN